jgi:hypothetical protein
MVQADRIAKDAQYCESDVLNTYRLWLIYELFRGNITSEQLAYSEAQAADFVRTRKSDNPHLLTSHCENRDKDDNARRHSAPCFNGLPELE